ncbi:MAG: hypothetical protein ACYSW0_11320 [Planctomycetota bacterium]|jgi:hypothetical protein
MKFITVDDAQILIGLVTKSWDKGRRRGEPISRPAVYQNIKKKPLRTERVGSTLVIRLDDIHKHWPALKRYDTEDMRAKGIQLVDLEAYGQVN